MVYGILLLRMGLISESLLVQLLSLPRHKGFIYGMNISVLGMEPSRLWYLEDSIYIYNPRNIMESCIKLWFGDFVSCWSSIDNKKLNWFLFLFSSSYMVTLEGAMF